MKLINPGYEILTEINSDEMFKHIENCGRQCYQSTHRITEGSAPDFVKMILDKGHESVIEHSSISVLFTSNRGFSHELVRHRISSFAQESTRFCNYSLNKFDNEINCIDLRPSLEEYGKIPLPKGEHTKEKTKRPLTPEEVTKALGIFADSWEYSQKKYQELTDMGIEAQFARNLLPIGLKTSIVITANLRQWREIFRQRTSKFAHPQMLELMRPLLAKLQEELPLIFNDIEF